MKGRRRLTGEREEGHNTGEELMVGLLLRVGEKIEEERLEEVEMIIRTETKIKNSRRKEEDIGVEVEAIEAIEAAAEAEGASIRITTRPKHLLTLWPIFLPCLPRRTALNQARPELLIRL